jgi:glycosyltransferase involved in cell wall biosynthesis
VAAYDRPIRVLRVIARLNVGGPALHVSYLSRGLDEIGYETTLVAGKVGGAEGSMEYLAGELGLQPLDIPELQREISPFADAVAARRLLALIKELRPDVLHTHTAKAGAVGRIAARLAGRDRPKAVVHTFHGHVLHGYFGPLKTHAFRQLERSLARSTDALVAVSPEVRNDLVSLGVAPASRIAVIRLGLDLEARLAVPRGAAESLRTELRIPVDAVVVSWLGRMTEIKRVDQLLEAFTRVAVAAPDTYLLLVGDGPLRAALEAQALRLGVASRCRFIGFRNDVGTIYALSDVVALTSANEGTPVSVIEAQAAGVPAVSTDVGGVRDIVADGVSGFVVPAGDPMAVAHRLIELAADTGLRRHLGEAGRLRTVERYGVPRLVSDVDRLYRELLQQAAPRTHPIVRARKPLERAIPAAVTARLPQRLDPLSILLMTQYFPPEVGATQSRMQSFAEYLAERGHQVTVVAEFPNHPLGVIPPEYHGHIADDDRSNAYRILRVWVKTSAEKTQMTRLSFYLSYMALATAVAPAAGRADVVLATTPPLFAGLAGLATARMMGAPFVLDVRDLWPAAATSLMQIDPGWETRVAEAIERRLYRGAAVVTAVTQPFVEHVDSIRVDGTAPTMLLPNGTLERFFADVAPADADRLGAGPDEFLVAFAGTMGIAQALPSAIEAAEKLNGNVKLAFIGEGPMKEIVTRLAQEKALDNVTFHSQRPVEEIPAVLAGADALLVSLSSHPTFEQFVPSKMIDFMAAGRPILLAAAGESARLLESARAGIVVTPEDPEALAAGVRWLAEHPAEAAAMGARGRAFAATRLRSVQAEQLERLMLDLVGERKD